MRSVVENSVSLNSGDAAILLALQKMLIDAIGRDAEIYVFDSQPGPPAVAMEVTAPN